MKTKQVIVIRKDLKMRKGKMIAQGAHASMAVILQMMKRESAGSVSNYNKIIGKRWTLDILPNTALESWLLGKFTKVCVYVESEKELDEVYDYAKSKGYPCSLIVDSGLTEFKNEPTKTAVAIGPEQIDLIDQVTGHLKLL
jgi:PTH2 family peptidyl-tRNA hydrolase